MIVVVKRARGAKNERTNRVSPSRFPGTLKDKFRACGWEKGRERDREPRKSVFVPEKCVADKYRVRARDF